METTRCINCKAALHGPFCSNCGEKKISSSDFSLGKLLEQAVDVFTHLDSKLFKSARALLFSPGLLPLEFVDGRRKPYMKPFQVFFLCNILFFIFLSNYDVFLIPSKWFFMDGNYSEMSITRLAHSIAEKKHISMESLALLYDARVTSLSKLLVIVLVPILALGSWLFGFKRHSQYGKHFIFALYLLSYFMLFLVFVSWVARALPFNITPVVFVTTTFIVYAIYTFFALKRFNGKPLWLQITGALFITALYIALSVLYREWVSVLSLKML